MQINSNWWVFLIYLLDDFLNDVLALFLVKQQYWNSQICIKGQMSSYKIKSSILFHNIHDDFAKGF